jgi:AraC-like DNA-binding protein
MHAILGLVTERSLPETCYDGERSTVWLGPGGRAAYLGRTLDLGVHSGSVACFALGVDAPFLLRIGNAEHRTVRSAFIPARTRHRIVADAGGRMLFRYLDPRSPEAALLRGRMTAGPSGVTLDHRDELEMLRHVRATGSADLAAIIGHGPSTPIDARIRDALSIMHATTGQQISAAQLAGRLNLSQSRFLHLFSAHAGTSFRRYRLWARMMHVAEAVGQGVDVTTAAVEAGYASASHFSDTFRIMFGLPITSLLTRPTRFVVSGPAVGP